MMLSSRYRLLTLVIALSVIAVFSPVLWHDFVSFDDHAFVLHNPYMQSGLTLDGIRWAFTSGYESNWIPLTWISHMLDVQLFGMNPAGHHVVNVVFHATSSVLLFVFLNRSTNAPWQSACVSFLFALHPLRVESVAWVAERKDVLSVFFMMLTLVAYSHYKQTPNTRTYLTTLGLFMAGLLSKPMLVSLPILLLLLDWWPLGRFSDATIQNRFFSSRLFLEKIPFFILSFCSSLITYLVQHTAGTAEQSFTLAARSARVSVSYIDYLYKTVWPSKLAVIYPFSKYPPTSIEVAASAVLLMLITCAAIVYRKRYPYLMTGWLWYMVTMLPVIGLIQVGQHSIADRYTYIPHIGIFLITAWGIPQLMGEWRWKGATLRIVSSVVLIAMIVLTSQQLRYWKNSGSLFSHALDVTENNWVAHDNLGQLLLDQGQIDEAVQHFSSAVQAKPSYVPAYMNLGVALHAKGKTGEAINAYKTAAMIQPRNPKIYLDLGYLYLELGERKSAVEQYRLLKEFSPAHATTLMTLIQKTDTANGVK